MKNSPLPINGKKLAARWGVETIDLIYIMLNHDLNVVDHYLSEIGIDDVLEDFKKYKDTSDYMFSLSKVKDIEYRLEIDGEISFAETIRGKNLMARWDMHEAEIFSLMLNSELDCVDPFGHSPNFKTIFLLIDEGTLLACKSSPNKMINGDQFHQETMQQMYSEALSAGRVKLLGGASLEDALNSLAAGRVQFVAVKNPAELGIK